MTGPEFYEACPCCGGPAIDGYHQAYSIDSSFSFIGCNKCPLWVPYWNDHDRQKAIETWNRRNSPIIEICQWRSIKAHVGAKRYRTACGLDKFWLIALRPDGYLCECGKKISTKGLPTG